MYKSLFLLISVFMTLSSQANVKGQIDSVTLINSGNHLSIKGWACDYKKSRSIKIHTYVKDSSGKKTMISNNTAGMKSEAAVSKVCGTSGSNHRFHVAIAKSIYKSHADKSIYIYGISVSGGKNLPIALSGTKIVPKATSYVSELKNDNRGNLTIPAGGTYILNKNISANHLLIKGELRCGNNSNRYYITAKAISVYGKFTCGESSSRYSGKLDIRLKSGLELENSYGGMGQRGLFVHSGGVLKLHGAKKNHSWVKLQNGKIARKGHNYLLLDRSVNWKVGDSIAISSTGFYSNEAEEFKIKSIQSGGRKLILDGTLKNAHLSTIKNYSQSGKNIKYDSRAVVANLSRDIHIYPFGGNYNSSELGAHTMVMVGGKAYVDSVEFTKMGRKGEMARYPFHWHMLGDARGQYIKNSSIHDSFQRCVTIHATNYATIDNNVCYNHFGHGYFLEDGSEVGNVIKNNVGFQSKLIASDKSILISDTARGGVIRRFPTPSTYWISNPTNIVTDNIAAGSEGSGFWMAFENRTICNRSNCSNPISSKTTAFHRNTAHSNKVGITWDGAPGTRSVKNPRNEDDRFLISALYRPTVKTTFDKLSVFKNRESGIYFRGKAVSFTNTMIADNAWGAFVAFSQHFKDSVIVGRSSAFSAVDNHHFKRFDHIRGIVLYDGPFELENVTFHSYPKSLDKSYKSTPVPFYSIGGANRYENKVKGLKFSPEPWARIFFDTNAKKGWSDSFNSSSIKDIDGSLSGVKGALVVPNHIFNYQRGKCTEKSSWDAYICRNNYRAGIIKFSSPTTHTNYTYFKVKNIEGETKYMDESKFHSKMNVILNRKDGFYTVERRGQFADDKNYTIYFHAEGVDSSSVLKILDGANCSVANTKKYSTLAALHNSADGYYIRGKDLYFKAKSKTLHPTHAKAQFSEVRYNKYNVSCR